MHIGDGVSKDVVIFSSVFQCSVIGAILFLVKVNDLTDALQLFLSIVCRRHKNGRQKYRRELSPKSS